MIYLDHAATTPVAQEVLEIMIPFFSQDFANPSGIYKLSKGPRQAIKTARAQVAGLINALPENIIFTSGGTEANNTVLKSVITNPKKHIITTSVEHASIITTCHYLIQNHNVQVTWLPVCTEGFIDLNILEKSITKDTYLLSVIHANNEIGTLQDIEKIVEIARRHDVLVHLDSTQAVGKIPVDVQALDVDFLTISAHKLYGPKGVGALYVKNIKTFQSYCHGGGQENNLRGGTENVAGIAGFGKAAALAQDSLYRELQRLRSLQQNLIQHLKQYKDIKLNGPTDLEKRIPGNVNFSIQTTAGDSSVLQFSLNGIAVSSGSACSNNMVKPSHVLLAIGNTEQDSKNSVRVTFGQLNTEQDVDRFLTVLTKILHLSPVCGVA